MVSTMASNLKNFIYQNLDLIFVSLFLVLTVSMLWVPPRWDEYIYLNFVYFPLSPPYWVPHPPLLWYLLAVFSLIPRLAVLMTSVIGILFLYYTCRRLYGSGIARLAVAILATNWLYVLLGSLVMFTDGPVTAFMTISTISFLCWLKLNEQKFLLISGLGLALASLTKYTAAPIILGTSLVWLIFLGKRFERAKIFKMFGVATVSLLPLVAWSYLLYQKVGNFVSYYSTLGNLFPSTSLLAIFLQPNFAPLHLRSYIPLSAFNFGFYAGCFLALANVSLIPWVRQRQFDIDSKLLLAYITIILLPFVIISKQDFRYVLPIAPPLAIISAKNIEKEKMWMRFLIMFTQFLCAAIVTYVALILYPFK